MSSNAKKIGLIACTGVVAGNMMGSGIALLPSSLASVGSVSIFSWLICWLFCWLFSWLPLLITSCLDHLY